MSNHASNPPRRYNPTLASAVAAAFVVAVGASACVTDAPSEPVPEATATASAALSTDGSHNLLFIVADDVGVDNISGYQEHSNSADTPSIDSLADSGVLFRNTWVNPMCSPSRASLYTGRHAFRHGLLHPQGGELPSSEETLAEVLQGAGYATAMFGKWHLGSDSGTTPADQGFDYFSGVLEGNVSDYFEWTKTTQQFVGGVLTETEVTETGYATSVNVSEAESWISQQSSPWMVTLAFNAGHSPFHVPPASLHGVSLTGSEGDSCGGGSGADTNRKCYRAMVESMDSEIGNLIAWLDTQGELENTLIVFIGDNGTPGNVVIDDGVFSTTHGKTTVYEGGVNVPFVVYGPALGVQQGVEVSDLVQGLDAFATMREVAGASSSAGITVDSQSLVDYLLGNTVSNPRSYLYTELYNSDLSIDRWAMTNGTAKFLSTDGSDECYNLVQDPGEATDRYVAGGMVTNVCDNLSAQRPCAASSACPGDS